MSRTSSEWSGRAAPADIIDLDRFMRSARPTRSPHDRALQRNGQLVVDGGSLARARSSGSSASSAARSAPRSPRVRDKRFSHDSGLSDGSYARKRHRPHRRVSCAENPSRREAPARADSTTSLRAFRTACERALRDQQQAITRVAQLCQRLSERRERSTPDSSEMSSSSRSTRDQRRKDKHRAEECKTYKIIMTKLDELNRLFAARGRSPPPARAPRLDACPPRQDVCPPRQDVCPPRLDTCPPRADVRPPRETRRSRASASSVSVSDKLVSTDPQPVVENEQQISQQARRAEACARVERAAGGSPCARGDCGHVPRDNVAKCSSSVGGSSGAFGLHCGFDLDNPVHLYAQAKRLQALHATTHARSPHAGGAGGAGGARRAWAGCVRAVGRCLAAPLCCPATWD